VGRKISRFEGKYAVIVGPLLRELILDNKEKFEATKEKDLAKSKYYRKIFTYGRKVGSLASEMVVRTSKTKKISGRVKLRLLKSFRLKVNNVISLGNKNIKELEKLVRLSVGR
jgi:Ni,Fe-hydrogenase I large subunit